MNTANRSDEGSVAWSAKPTQIANCATVAAVIDLTTAPVTEPAADWSSALRAPDVLSAER